MIGPDAPRRLRGDTSGQSRQFALVGLAICGLVLAALAMPPAASYERDGGSDGIGGGDGIDVGDGFDLPELDEIPLLDWLLDESDGEADGDDGDGGGDGGGGSGDGVDVPIPNVDVPIPNFDVPIDLPPIDLIGEGSADGCVARFGSEPVPGTNVSLYVWNEGEPVVDRPVWFNDERVGRTDARGRVRGQVPYAEELDVTVSLPEEIDDCEFENTGEDDGLLSGLGGIENQPDRPPARAPLPAGAPVAAGGVYPAADGTVLGQDQTTGPGAGRLGGPPAQSSNASNTVDTGEGLNIGVDGRPLPGERVTLVVSVKNVRVPDANVTVDGQFHGRTDARGRIPLGIPEDGTERLSVTATRGELAVSRTVDVSSLQVRIEPDRPLPLPGQAATIEASFDGEPAPDAVVRFDGEPIGRTDENGTLAFTLPNDGQGTVVAESRGLTASAAVWHLFLPTLLSVGLLVIAALGSTAAVARKRGPRAGAALACGWVVVLSTFAAWLVAGPATAQLVLFGWLGLGLLAGAVLALVRTEEVTARSASLLARIRQTVTAWLFTVVGALEQSLAKSQALAGRLVAWLRSLPLSPSSLLGRLVAWLGTLPGRVAARLREFVASLGLRRLGGVLLAVAVVAGGTALFGPWGFLASVAIVLLAWAVLRRRDEQAAAEESMAEQASAPGRQTAESAPSAAARRRRTLREMFREFARRVRPARWRASTPGEISRDAVDGGYPSEPVDRLTGVFRDVEYGEAPDEAGWERARTAYERLTDEEGSES